MCHTHMSCVTWCMSHVIMGYGHLFKQKELVVTPSLFPSHQDVYIQLWLVVKQNSQTLIDFCGPHCQKKGLGL